jgi:GDPmannose 4,6-dehydratase
VFIVEHYGEINMKRALITGITGQDGSYLAELLLEKGYEVHGIVRRVSIEDPTHRMWRILHIQNRLHLHAASLESLPSLYRVFHAVKPDECYHLAAQSFVAYSFEDEFSTLNININGTHHVLSALRDCVPTCRFYFAASSEMFGRVVETPQTEMTPLYPRSAYGISKVTGFQLTRNYREAYGIKASCGILYNHESPRRGFEFVTRKITSTAAKIKLGLAGELRLGNLEAKRDWGHAGDYVQAMWAMLQQPEPGDYVIATGEQHSVREFADIAFSHLGLSYGDYLTIDPQLIRPAEVETLLGNATKAKNRLGWSHKVSFKELVTEMVEADLRMLSASPAVTGHHRPVRKAAGLRAAA